MRKPIFVRPVNGLQPRKLDGSHIPKSGCYLPDNRYTRRLLSEASVEKCDPPKTTVDSKAVSKKTQEAKA